MCRWWVRIDGPQRLQKVHRVFQRGFGGSAEVQGVHGGSRVNPDGPSRFHRAFSGSTNGPERVHRVHRGSTEITG